MKPALHPPEKPHAMTTKKIGDVILDVQNISACASAASRR